MKIDAMKNKLEKRLAELSRETREIDAELHEPGNPDFEERAVEIEGEEILEGLGKVALDEIEQIKSALTRIELGTYGVCVVCGEDISNARLNAVPYAAKCIKCAGK
jgi:RNA polymerase-binding transcription factor DksA